jgi:hypothetical protein
MAAAIFFAVLAFKSGGMVAVTNARTALQHYTSLQEKEGDYMQESLVESVYGGLKKHFIKPINQRNGYSQKEVQQLIGYFMPHKCAKQVDFRMATLVLLQFLAVIDFKQVAAIKLNNVVLLKNGKVRTKLCVQRFA